MDAEIREKFLASVEAAAAGSLHDWNKNPDSALALILLLDQFSLNIFREGAKGYILSDRALPLALECLDRGYHLNTHPVKKSFFYLPLEHAEDLELQRRAVELFRSLEIECKKTFWESWANEAREFADRHLRVVERFGRFPHRNAALGRTSTPEEIEFLKAGIPF